MNWLPKEVQDILDLATLQTEQLISNTTEVLDQAITEVDQSLDDLLEPLITEVEKGLDDLLDPILVDIVALDQVLEEWASPLTQRLYPLLDQHPVCVGCRHYHGRAYGDNFLVCGMHPYGAQSESCADWESC